MTMKVSAIAGVRHLALEPKADERGSLVELYKNEWTADFSPVQWNLVRNRANVLRGLHCHVRHTDLLAVVDGEMILGLRDLRQKSLTSELTEQFIMTPDSGLVLVPPGVAHCFYFKKQATIINAVSHVWSKEDELGCRWDDQDLGLDWVRQEPILSERDRTAGSLANLRSAVNSALAAR